MAAKELLNTLFSENVIGKSERAQLTADFAKELDIAATYSPAAVDKEPRRYPKDVTDMICG